MNTVMKKISKSKTMERFQKSNIIEQCKNKDIVQSVNISMIDEAKNEIDLLFENDAFIIFAVKNDKWNQWSFKKSEIDNDFLNNLLYLDNDTYMAINSFKSPKRLISNLYSLNAIWSDIDYYNIDKYKNKSYEEMVDIISKNKIIKKAPPSFWMYSGKGLYAFWLLENANANYCLPIWNVIMNTIQEELVKYGADPKSSDGAHVLRVAGSRNSKTGNIAEMIKEEDKFIPKRYTIRELSDLLLPKLEYTKEEWLKLKEKSAKDRKYKRKVSKSTNKKYKAVTLFNIHKLNYSRMNDISSLIELRGGECEHYRELMLFLYRYWGNCFYKDKDKALEEIKEINNMFSKPLESKEVIKATKKAEDAAEIWKNKIDEYYSLEVKPSVKTFFKNTGAYIYSNKKLIDILDISYEEMIAKNSKGEFILKTIFSTKAKNYRSKDYRNEWLKDYRKTSRRNENGLTSREQSKLDNIYKILELQEKGYKQIEIAEQIGIDKSVVSRYVKEIRQNNITIESFNVKKDKEINNDDDVRDTVVEIVI